MPKVFLNHAFLSVWNIALFLNLVFEIIIANLSSWQGRLTCTKVFSRKNIQTLIHSSSQCSLEYSCQRRFPRVLTDQGSIAVAKGHSCAEVAVPAGQTNAHHVAGALKDPRFEFLFQRDPCVYFSTDMDWNDIMQLKSILLVEGPGTQAVPLHRLMFWPLLWNYSASTNWQVAGLHLDTCRYLRTFQLCSGIIWISLKNCSYVSKDKQRMIIPAVFRLYGLHNVMCFLGQG